MKPKIIAWSKGLQIIPYEHVIAVDEHFNVSGAVLVMVDLKTSNPTGYLIKPSDAQEFVDKYNVWLAAVEGLQIQVKDGDIPLVQQEHVP